MTLFIDPVAQVKITDGEAGNEWLWTLPDYPYLTGLTINYEFERVAGFSFTVDIPYEEGLKMMRLPSPFKQGNIVAARIGYSSDAKWMPWVGGQLNQGGAGLSIDANGVNGTVNVKVVAESYGYTIDKELLRTAGWDPIKILSFAAEAMGLEAKVSTQASFKLNAYKLVADRRGKSIRSQTHAFSSELLNLSNWEAIKSICKKWNLSFWIGPDVGATDPGRNLFVYTKAEVAKGVDQDPDARVYMVRGVVDESKLQYPALAWSPEGSEVASWLVSQSSPAAHGVDAATINGTTGEDEIVEVPPEEQPVMIFGVVAKQAPEDKKAADGTVMEKGKKDGSLGDYASYPMDDGGQDEFKTKVQAKQQQGNPAQKGSITTLGNPDERTGNLCKLRGAGDIYDGPYIIDKITHTYAPGSWEMTLVCHRDGTVFKDRDQSETPEGQMKA